MAYSVSSFDFLDFLIILDFNEKNIETKSNSEFIQCVEKRIELVHLFIKKICCAINIILIPIHDPFGPTITEPDIQAIVCSAETLKSCHKINDMRHHLGWTNIQIFSIPLLSIENDVKFSSSFLRAKLYEKDKSRHIERNNK